MSEPSSLRLSQAEHMSADACFNPLKQDVPGRIKEETSGIGVDLAMVDSGNPKAIVQALSSVRRGGRVCLFGVPVKDSSLDYDVSQLVTNEISVISSNAATEEDTKEALQLINLHRIDVKSLVTHRFPLDRFAEAVETAKRTECIKCIVVP